MAAKRIKTCVVIFRGCLNSEEAQSLIDHVGPRFRGSIQEDEAFVCPHCGKLWPTCNKHSNQPLMDWQYQQRVEIRQRKEPEYDYCCDDARQDCEGANADS